MGVRTFRINQALESVRALTQHLPHLTEEEVLEALEIECSTARRQTIVDRLISRAARLHEIEYANQLKEKYHGKD